MAEQDKKQTREGFRRLAKLSTPRKDQGGQDQLAVELIVKDGKTDNGGNFAMVVVHVPGADKITRDGLVVNRFSNEGDETFTISVPTGRKINIDGEEKNEYGPYLTGRVVNRSDDDPKMSSVSMSLYSPEDLPAMLDALNAAGDNKEERIKVYEQYQNQLWGFAERQVEEATNGFFGIKPSAAYVERMKNKGQEASQEAPEQDAPEQDVPEADAPQAGRKQPAF